MALPQNNITLRAELALLSVTALWGFSFILISVSLNYISAPLLVTLRFGFGALLLSFFLINKPHCLNKTVWKAGACTGFFIFLGYLLQTYGLKTIPSSISAFLTALYVPFVPMLQILLFRKIPQKAILFAIALAFIGMVLIIDPSKISFSGSVGEWLTICSAVACASEILVLSHFANKCDPVAFSFTQLVVVSLCSLTCVIITDDWNITFSWQLVFCMAVLIGMIAYNQAAMSWGQKFVSPSRAVLIYTMEPVFAGIVGVCAGEKITLLAFIGAALVIASVLVSSFVRTKPESASQGENA